MEQLTSDDGNDDGNEDGNDDGNEDGKDAVARMQNLVRPHVIIWRVTLSLYILPVMFLIVKAEE